MRNNKLDIEKINQTCIKYNVASLYLFGSRASETSDIHSDYDFLVYFKPIELLDYADNFFDLAHELEKVVGSKIDLVSGKSLKNPFFIKEIELSKKLIYG